MEEPSLACLNCAAVITDDGEDYCSTQCLELHQLEISARMGGRPREAGCGHLVPRHRGVRRQGCSYCSSRLRVERVIPCRGCGTEFPANAPGQRYCSFACRARHLGQQRQERIEADRRYKNCGTCSGPLAGRSTTAKFCSTKCADIARGVRLPAPLTLRICALSECGAEFQPKSHRQRCCCEKHGKTLDRHRRRAAGLDKKYEWNDKRRDAYHRRRALKKAASTGEPVLMSEIRERDKNRCHLCDRRVGQKAWPHPLSPSLDHVVPLSKGGAHDPANVKLAHLECNTRKGNRGGGEQLLLIG